MLIDAWKLTVLVRQIGSGERLRIVANILIFDTKGESSLYPYVVGKFASELVNGIQSEGAAACGKHFVSIGKSSQIITLFSKFC